MLFFYMTYTNIRVAT